MAVAFGTSSTASHSNTYDDETGVGSGWTAGIIINTSVTDGFYHDPPTGTGSYTSKFSHMQVWR